MDRQKVIGALFGLTFGYVGILALACYFRWKNGHWPIECPDCGAWN